MNWRDAPTIRVVIAQRGKGKTAWAVLVNDEVVVNGLTARQAEGHKWWLEFCAKPEQRAAARERITGG